MTAGSVLVVDDDKNIRLLLSQCLEEAGYEVNSAVDGEHAVKKAEERRFDLVLLDMKLPGIDGLQVLRKLRSLWPDLPIVIITAHGTIETAVEAMKQGAVDYLQKPFTPEEIRAIVQRNIAKADMLQINRDKGFEQCIAEAREFLRKYEPDKAIPLLRWAVHADPGRPEPFNLMGVADELRGRLDAARRMYRVALALDPSYKPAADNLDRVVRWQYVRDGINMGDPAEE